MDSKFISVASSNKKARPWILYVFYFSFIFSKICFLLYFIKEPFCNRLEIKKKILSISIDRERSSVWTNLYIT